MIILYNNNDLVKITQLKSGRFDGCNITFNSWSNYIVGYNIVSLRFTFSANKEIQTNEVIAYYPELQSKTCCGYAFLRLKDFGAVILDIKDGKLTVILGTIPQGNDYMIDNIFFIG